jgi:Family of unknown function (DUF6308)
MADGEFEIHVERLDGELLILDGLALARGFFAGDPSSVGEAAFDSVAGLGNSERIELTDVMAMNRTMRARSPHTAWSAIIDAKAPWLSSVPAELDLLETTDTSWHAAKGDELIAAALAATIGPGRGMAVATKLLHLKRPRLFPMLDRLVAEMLGAGLPNDPTSARRVEMAIHLTRAIRSEGRRNVDTLRRICEVLSAEGKERSLVRIFDAMLWLAHPAAGVEGVRRAIEVRATPRDATPSS